MATITPTIVDIGSGVGQNANGPSCVVTWANVTEADTCSPVELVGLPDRSVQIAGTFGAATCVLQGSNDGTNYATLTDPQGNAISKTSAAIEMVAEVARYTRPSASGGTGQSLTISMLCRRNRS